VRHLNGGAERFRWQMIVSHPLLLSAERVALLKKHDSGVMGKGSIMKIIWALAQEKPSFFCNCEKP
jgi:hypothetical protein